MSDVQTDTYFLAGILVRFLVREPEAGYSLVEAIVGPGAGPPPNRHQADNEAFYVLEGTFEFRIGSETRIAKSGEFVQVPNGEIHTFRNIEHEPGRLLIMNAPGALHIAFFSQAGDPMPSGMTKLPNPLPPPDVARLLEVGQRNGMEFVLPQR